MVDVYETAYPRFKPDLTTQEIQAIYSPSQEDIKFARGSTKALPLCIYLMVLLKSIQRLGYFPMLSEVPNSIIQFLIKQFTERNVSIKSLISVENSDSRQRFMEYIRLYLKVKPITPETIKAIEQASQQAAETKQELADIINVVIEELIRQSFELPAFSTLSRIAQRIRSKVNEEYYTSIINELSSESMSKLDNMLTLSSRLSISGWQKIKQEPKKPTNKEIRQYIEHIQWLKVWEKDMPTIDHIPFVKRQQYVYEARALDIKEMKALKPNKRYALMIVLLHAQLGKVLDDAVDMYIKTLRKLHFIAEQRLQEYFIEHQKRAEKLITQLRDVLEAFQGGQSNEERGERVASAIHSEPALLLAECEEHIAYSGNNYIPFLQKPYQSHRPLLLNCLSLLELKPTSSDISLIHAINFILEHRSSHKVWLEYPIQNGSLKWIPEKWRKLIFDQSQVTSRLINRKYFELCVLTETMRDLQSGDLYVSNSDQYSDYRDQLIDWDEYEQQSFDYGAMLDIPIDPQEFTNHLKQWLANTASIIDKNFPNNEGVELNGNEIIIRKQTAQAKPATLDRIDKQLTERLPEKNILDILVETEKWLDLHKQFKPLSGFEGKIDDPRKRFVTSLFCYGCNLGPSQTARSIKGFNRRQIAWLNLRYITEERLDKAIVQVVNAYNKFLLPKYWGTGKSASADGTKWNMYEQNLLSEYHIRYGGYGGIGYYHVSDMYIALFSHFIPCGVYEAIYILDGLIKNESDIQPDTLHGDTHAQSAPVFGLAYLLGINLMPRIRNLKKLVFFKPDRTIKYTNINGIFSESIQWDLIETHLPDMLRIVLSIKAGKITPSTILKRLGTSSRKNKLYFAFRELGRVVRTEFLLKYIGDADLRKTISAATNKSEEFNQFIKWLFFGNQGVIAENIRYEQRKVIKYNQLVANLAILHNVEAMTGVLKQLQSEGEFINEEVLGGLAPYRTEHINRYGDYILNLDQKSRPLNYSVKIINKN
ncbi:Tn3 family transposase [Acinetobacter sp. ANC 3882]|uniref:Tn3 family transposase n=1 Tax=Acinetobacter sp. ANC 3882 TaxID=2923423 RepID=UPI001F4B2B1B|nr:Tn3 family transposase [Acinetobacter sp. ANC 3882]MCH7313121.1 Tn3 family transposase [Acinetobacter sp. ANC 3882]